jgi:hypothetical protein
LAAGPGGGDEGFFQVGLGDEESWGDLDHEV